MSFRSVVLVAVVAAALAPCGDDDAAVETDDSQGRSPDGEPMSISLAFDQSPTDDDVDATTAVIERRLDELGVGDTSTIERSGDQLTVLPVGLRVEAVRSSG